MVATSSSEQETTNSFKNCARCLQHCFCCCCSLVSAAVVAVLVAATVVVVAVLIAAVVVVFVAALVAVINFFACFLSLIPLHTALDPAPA